MNLPLKAYWDLLSDHIRPQKGRFILLTVLLVREYRPAYSGSPDHAGFHRFGAGRRCIE